MDPRYRVVAEGSYLYQNCPSPMRIPLYLLLFLGLVLGAAACDTFSSESLLNEVAPANDSALSDSVQQLYREDAARLTLRRVLREQPPQAQKVGLPRDRIQLLYNALVHVYNAEEISARDTIVGIHIFPRKSVNRVTLALDSSVAWTQRLQVGNRLTGHPKVDSLLQTYDLSVESRDETAYHKYATLLSEEPVNTMALSRKFEPIEGVDSASGYAGISGDGPDIEASVGEKAILLDYSVGWGDTPAGCIHRAYWTYRIEEDGTVRYRGRREE